MGHLLRALAVRRTALAKRSTKRDGIERKLTQLCRRLVVEVRDQHRCQRCGKGSPSQIQWAHVKTRGAKSLVYVPWASLALCAGCHFWFDGNKGRFATPGPGLKWWQEKFPDRWIKLACWETGPRRPVDRNAELVWLRNELKKAEVSNGLG